ncbi:MAG: NAD-binding protein [Alistipes sp.]
MKIVIAGVGEVGSHLAKMLGSEYHEITVVDNDPKRLESIAGMVDVIVVEGIARLCDPEKAAVRKADLYIAVLPEETERRVGDAGKQLGARKTIARIDNNEYLLSNRTTRRCSSTWASTTFSIRRKPRHRRSSTCWGIPARPNTSTSRAANSRWWSSRSTPRRR